MKIQDLDGADKRIIDSLKEQGISELREQQEDAVKKGLFKNRNIIISSPTASGKTLVAELAFLNSFFRKNGKSVYIVPLKSLAREKYEEFTEKYSKYGLKVGISTGDFDSKNESLRNHDLIIATSEKLDSLVRHKTSWLAGISTVIIDEIHLLNDSERGPTLEFVITGLLELNKEAQLVGLSATIKNSKDIADWLNAELVYSNYRPVELREGVYFENNIHFGESKENLDTKEKEPELKILEDTVKKNKQALVFFSSKRNAESNAEKSTSLVKKYVKEDEISELEAGAKKILKALSSPTQQCRKLSELVKSGCAFHHSGLVAEQRKTVEELFKKGRIKVIFATPTLAFGVNLPAFRVLIRDLKRYSMHGMDWIPTLEYKQFAGRAGRPKYDSRGEAITIAKTQAGKEEIEQRFINGETEEIYSKLGVEPVLRTIVLALVSTHFCSTKQQIMDFISRTFYSFQYKDLKSIEEKIDSVIELLEKFEFINKENEKLKATLLGARVSELYLDPLSAKKLIDGLKKADGSETNAISFLHLSCTLNELRPLLRVSNSELEDLQYLVEANEHLILTGKISEWDWDYDEKLRAFKTAVVFSEWINEATEQKLLERFKVTPGELHTMILSMDWILYSCVELSKLLDCKNIITKLMKLRIRVKNGVKEELLKLLKLKGIGRARGRKLYNAGIKSVGDVKKADIKKLELLLGRKTAESIVKQVTE